MVFFITEEWLKKHTPLTKNLDVTEITPWLETCAKLWIKPLLGKVFFDDLLIKFNNNTLSSDEMVLVNHIKFALAWKSAAEVIDGATYQLKNKGVVQQSGDNIESVELSEVQYLKSQYMHKGENFEEQVYDYLKDNKDLYPVFMQENNKDSLARKRCSGYDGFNTMMII